MRAVITAGGTLDDAFARAAGSRIKALAPVRGRTMLDRAIDAIRECGITEIAVIGERELHAACNGRARWIEGKDSGAGNVSLALRAWADDEPLLYCTSDLPYINGAALRDFIDRTPSNALTMPLTEHDDFVRRFPDSPPFGITLAGERIVNGGTFVIPAGALERVEHLAATMFDARKAPWQMAKLAGPMFLLRFAMKRLSIAELERRAELLLEIPAIGIRHAAPELAYDADIVEEYLYACERT